MMKLPGLSKKVKVVLTPEQGDHTPPQGGGDHIYALLRRLAARVSELEIQASVCKRDIARIERKTDREAVKEAAGNHPAAVVGWFGLE